jgi:thymidylate kinase
MSDAGASGPFDKPIVIAVDGLIGAGKSTFLDAFAGLLTARGIPTLCVPEPVEEWTRGGHLQKFYAGIESGVECYNFQTYAHVTRSMAFARVWDKACADGKKVILVERWPTTDRYVFMENLRDRVGPVDMEKYEKWWDYWEHVTPAHPSQFIYIRPSLEQCMARCHARARDGEVGKDEDDDSKKPKGVTAEYQAQLLELHDLMFEVGPDGHTPRADVTCVGAEHADLDFSVAGSERETVLEHVFSALQARELL